MPDDTYTLWENTVLCIGITALNESNSERLIKYKYFL